MISHEYFHFINFTVVYYTVLYKNTPTIYVLLYSYEYITYLHTYEYICLDICPFKNTEIFFTYEYMCTTIITISLMREIILLYP